MSMFGLFNLPVRVALAGLIGATAVSFAVVPLDQNLPIHWGISGDADWFVAAPYALGLPLAMMLVLSVGALALGRNGVLARDMSVARTALNGVLLAFGILALALLAGTSLIGLGFAIDMVQMVVIGVLILFAFVGNYLPKTRPNRLIGVRVPWTLNDADNWRITHLWTGRLMLALALAALLVAIFGASIPIYIALVVVTGLAPMVTGIAIAGFVARRKR